MADFRRLWVVGGSCGSWVWVWILGSEFQSRHGDFRVRVSVYMVVDFLTPTTSHLEMHLALQKLDLFFLQNNVGRGCIYRVLQYILLLYHGNAARHYTADRSFWALAQMKHQVEPTKEINPWKHQQDDHILNLFIDTMGGWLKEMCKSRLLLNDAPVFHENLLKIWCGRTQRNDWYLLIHLDHSSARDFANSFHPTIKFTSEMSPENTVSLSTEIFKGQQRPFVTKQRRRKKFYRLLPCITRPHQIFKRFSWNTGTSFNRSLDLHISFNQPPIVSYRKEKSIMPQS
ncbi:hypothetical protein pdam_00024610 [Pocillopora damicornis]|uniref:Uncharacterized protein n=1 Tax=Pocillopora damicornis TaxID=46731 RepID=A0A3M6UFS8_POCDA|nr:hypothetical protein pdam_00024610 [Pocillopora damicornis]